MPRAWLRLPGLLLKVAPTHLPPRFPGAGAAPGIFSGWGACRPPLLRHSVLPEKPGTYVYGGRAGNLPAVRKPILGGITAVFCASLWKRWETCRRGRSRSMMWTTSSASSPRKASRSPPPTAAWSCHPRRSPEPGVGHTGAAEVGAGEK